MIEMRLNRLVVGVLAAALTAVASPATRAPGSIRVWHGSSYPDHAVPVAWLRLELDAPADVRPVAVAVQATEGTVRVRALAPDRRAAIVEAAAPGRGRALGAEGELRIVWRVADTVGQREVRGSIPLHFYDEGYSLSFGEERLAPERQGPLFGHGFGRIAAGPPVNPRSVVDVRVDPPSLAGQELGEDLYFWALARPGSDVQLQACVQATAANGRVFVDMRPPRNEPRGLWYSQIRFSPADAAGQVRAGLTTIALAYAVRSKGRTRTVRTRLSVVVGPDGSSRAVNLRRRSPGVAAPTWSSVKRRRWLPVVVNAV